MALLRLIFVREERERIGEEPYFIAESTLEDHTPDDGTIRTVGLYKLVQTQRIKRATERLSLRRHA